MLSLSLKPLALEKRLRRDFNILRVSFPKCQIKPQLSEKSVPTELWTVCNVEEQNPISKSLCMPNVFPLEDRVLEGTSRKAWPLGGSRDLV